VKVDVQGRACGTARETDRRRGESRLTEEQNPNVTDNTCESATVVSLAFVGEKTQHHN
jgi:hypothetical protein